MTEKNDAATREELYAERGRNGVVLGRSFTFYSGTPTTPTNFTGNLLLGAHSNGAGANLLNGVGPTIETAVPCEDIIIESISCELGEEGVLHVMVAYNLLSDDIYALFNTDTGQMLTPLSANVVGGEIDLVFNVSSPPADVGAWSFKIMRLANPAVCFFVQPTCTVTA